MHSLLLLGLATTLLAAVVSASRLVVTNKQALQVTLAIQPLNREFLHHAKATVSWNVESGNYDPANDYITSWWTPFAATYVQYHNITGNNGSAVFDLLNARHGFFFRYYRGDTVIAETNEIRPEGSFPMGIRTTFVPEHVSRVRVIWTSNRTTGTEYVAYGRNPRRLQNVVFATQSLTYSHDELNAKTGLPPVPIRRTQFANLSARALRCGYGTCYNDFTALELFVDPGYFHVAELTDLLPGTQYHFRVGEEGGYFSAIYWFTSRVAPSPNATLQALYVADAGAGDQLGPYAGSASHNAVPVFANATEGARHVWDSILRDPLNQFDQVSIMNGDVSYARGWPYVWELFHNQTERLFTSAPVMVQYGNHEFDYGNNPFDLATGPDSGGECGIATGRRFNFASDTQPWYYMAMGPVTFVAISSEHSVTEQAQWLLQILPKVDRTVTPWLVVFTHRPLHMSSPWLGAINKAMREAYSDIFVRYGVDLVLTGHSHYYERMCEISCGVCADWGFRDVWTEYHHTALADPKCSAKHGAKKMKLNDCRVACLHQANCTGVYLKGGYDEGECYLSTCSQPFNLTYDYLSSTFSVSREPGMPPVYVMDGTAGGVYTDAWTPEDPITRYKDFFFWGYSRLFANATELSWNHYHIDGSIVDSVTLPPRNTGV